MNLLSSGFTNHPNNLLINGEQRQSNDNKFTFDNDEIAIYKIELICNNNLDSVNSVFKDCKNIDI